MHRISKQPHNQPAATDNSGTEKMTLTSYTKYVLNEGCEIVVNIANFFGFNEKQMAKLAKAGATFDERRGWMIEMSQSDYKQKCQALRGFEMGYFIMKH